MSSVLLVGFTVFAGSFAVALGLIHLAIPRIVRYAGAIGMDGPAAIAQRPPLGSIGHSALSYQLRRSDLIGLTWVMSNAASYVLMSIGLLDLAWAVGWRGLPVAIGASWIAGWWAIRAASQFALGRRRGDLLVATWFALLAIGHGLMAAG